MEQFKGELTGEKEAKEQKAKQFRETLRAEGQALLAENGLPPDYNLIPIFNFQNIASEAHADESLKLLEQLYTRAGEKMKGVFDEKELAKLMEFRNKAIENNKAALMMNRTLMAPIGE